MFVVCVYSDGSINIDCAVMVAEPLLETVAYCMNEEVKFTELRPHWSKEVQQKSDWMNWIVNPGCNFNVILIENYLRFLLSFEHLFHV